MTCHLKLNDILNGNLKYRKTLNDAKKQILCGVVTTDNLFAFSGEDSQLIIYNEKAELIYNKLITNTFINTMI